MKTKEELNALKEEVKRLNEKLSALTEEELSQVIGGSSLLGMQTSASEVTAMSSCSHFSKALKYASQDVPDTCGYCRFYRNDRCERRMN